MAEAREDGHDTFLWVTPHLEHELGRAYPVRGWPLLSAVMEGPLTHLGAQAAASPIALFFGRGFHSPFSTPSAGAYSELQANPVDTTSPAHQKGPSGALFGSPSCFGSIEKDLLLRHLLFQYRNGFVGEPLPRERACRASHPAPWPHLAPAECAGP